MFNLYNVFKNSTLLSEIGLYTYHYWINNAIKDTDDYYKVETRDRAFAGLVKDILCIMIMTFAYKATFIPV